MHVRNRYYVPSQQCVLIIMLCHGWLQGYKATMYLGPPLSAYALSSAVELGPDALSLTAPRRGDFGTNP